MKKLNAQDKLDILKLANKGASSTEIAKQYNITASTVRYVCKQYGVKIKPSYKVKLTKDDRDNIRDMYNNGVCVEDLANLYGVCKGTIYDITGGNLCTEVTVEDFEIDIDGYAEVISNINSGDYYRIEYIDKVLRSKESIIIDRDSALRLTELGYIIGYKVGRNCNSDRYLVVGPARHGSVVREALILHNTVKHITNLESLPDKRVFRLNIKKLIFGDCNTLNSVVVDLNGEDKKLSIEEYIHISKNTYYSSYDDDYIRVLKDRISVDYREELKDFLRSNICKAQLRLMIDTPVVTIKINSKLNYITAKTILKDKDIELCFEYSDNQKYIDKFINSLKNYRKKIELCGSDDIKIVKFHRGTSLNGGFYELRIGKTKVLTDTNFTSSSLYRGIKSCSDVTAKIGSVAHCIKTTRTYDSESGKTKFVMKVDYELLDTMKSVCVA